jgi:hypothetical protein
VAGAGEVKDEMLNVFPETSGFIKRVGYRGFLSMIWTLWRMNRSAKKMRIQCKAEIMFPVHWLK